MFNKIYALLAIVFFLKGLYCETAEDVVYEYQATLDTIVSDTHASVDDTGAKVGLSRANLEKNIASARRHLSYQIQALNPVVQHAINIAKSSGKNIHACIAAERQSINLLNQNTLNECRFIPELSSIYQQFRALKLKASKAATISKVCVNKFPGNDQTIELRHCLDESIKSVETSVIEIVNSIDDAVLAVDTKSNECVQAKCDGLDSQLNAITESFNSCVSKA